MSIELINKTVPEKKVNGFVPGQYYKGYDNLNEVWFCFENNLDGLIGLTRLSDGDTLQAREKEELDAAWFSRFTRINVNKITFE